VWALKATEEVTVESELEASDANLKPFDRPTLPRAPRFAKYVEAGLACGFGSERSPPLGLLYPSVDRFAVQSD